MKKVDITKITLEYEDVSGAGRHIKAMIGQKVPCVEFTMRGDVSQPITWVPDPAKFLLFTDRWIQFEPQAWKDMIDEVFTEMVKLWNEKHGDKGEEL